ncbi:MAG: hypothetical protein U0835_15875 [Isosphaeraceae bacterium]
MDEFAPVAAKARARASGWGLWAFIHVMLWLGILAFLVGVVPKFEVIFKDFGIALPASTRAAIAASRLVERFLLAVPLLLGSLAAWDSLIQMRLGTELFHPSALRRWNRWMAVAPLLFLLFLIVALVQPLFTLITKLSG